MSELDKQLFSNKHVMDCSICVAIRFRRGNHGSWCCCLPRLSLQLQKRKSTILLWNTLCVLLRCYQQPKDW